MVTWGGGASISRHCSKDLMSKPSPGVHDTYTAGGQMAMSCGMCWSDTVYSLRIILQQVGDQLVHCWKCGQCPLVEWEVVVGQMPPHYPPVCSKYPFLSQVSKTSHVSLPNTNLSFTPLLLPWTPDLWGFGGFAVSRTASGGKFYGTGRNKNSSPEEITQIIPEWGNLLLSYKRPYKSRRHYVRSQDLYCVWRNLPCLHWKIVFMGLSWSLNNFSTEKTAVLHVSGWEL